jgi:hypothetical protein
MLDMTWNPSNSAVADTQRAPLSMRMPCAEAVAEAEAEAEAEAVAAEDEEDGEDDESGVAALPAPALAVLPPRWWW